MILQPLIEQLKNSFHHNSERLGQHLRSHPLAATDACAEQPLQIWDRQTRTRVKTLPSTLPYEGMNIPGVMKISKEPKANLTLLGAIEV